MRLEHLLSGETLFKDGNIEIWKYGNIEIFASLDKETGLGLHSLHII